jgi:hypothetical protein
VLQSPFELRTSQTWRVSRELVQQTAELESRGLSRYRLRDGGTITYRHEYTARVSATDPAGAAIQVRSEVEAERPTGTVLIKTASVFTPDSVSIRAEIGQNGAMVYCREWQRERSSAVAPSC